MALDLFHTDAYRELISKHMHSTLEFLLANGAEFALAAEVEYLHFDPELPRSIRKEFDETVLFVMAGYTLESAQLDNASFVFEAGFGNENIGSTVTIPLLAIKQIFVREYPIAINISSPIREVEIADPDRSMEALLKNPENLKLLKKKE